MGEISDQTTRGRPTAIGCKTLATGGYNGFYVAALHEGLAGIYPARAKAIADSVGGVGNLGLGNLEALRTQARERRMLDAANRVLVGRLALAREHCLAMNLRTLAEDTELGCAGCPLYDVINDLYFFGADAVDGGMSYSRLTWETEEARRYVADKDLKGDSTEDERTAEIEAANLLDVLEKRSVFETVRDCYPEKAFAIELKDDTFTGAYWSDYYELYNKATDDFGAAQALGREIGYLSLFLRRTDIRFDAAGQAAERLAEIRKELLSRGIPEVAWPKIVRSAMAQAEKANWCDTSEDILKWDEHPELY